MSESNLDDTDDIGEGTTEPIPSPDATRRVNRRPIPADDVPPVAHVRPPLTRGPQSQPLPPQPGMATPYAGQELPRAAHSRRARRPNYPPRPTTDKASSGLYLPWWSLVLMLAFVGCAAIGALAVVTSLEANVAPGGGTPLVIVITSTFTVGPPASPTAIPQRATLTPSLPLPTIPSTLTLPPGNFAIGNTVLVVGVGPSGLNVRSGPGTDSTVKFLAHDGETYILKDGPQTASSDEWWMIQDAADSTKSGWASRRFLTVQSAAPATQKASG